MIFCFFKREDSERAENIVCLSTSGNGYNWASTLTWAAEIVRDAVNKADIDNKTGDRAYLIFWVILAVVLGRSP